MRPLTIVKVWYQNDPLDSGHRDQRLARAWLADPRVRRVVHVEPPVRAEQLAAAADSPALAAARARAGLLKEGELWRFTPTLAAGAKNPWRAVLEQTGRVLQQADALGADAVLWINAPSQLGEQLLQAFGARFGRVVVEIEDDHRPYHAPHSPARVELERRYRRLARHADLLIGNNATLLREWSRYQPRAQLVRNAVDAAAYRTRAPEPAFLAGVGRPRLVYAGNLRLRLQPELFAAVARAFPHATLVLVGVGGEALQAALSPFRNVRFLGPQPSAAIPALLQHADVLLLPHAVNALTEAMDPQKLFEYLASGRPIVATPVAGARDHGELLTLAADADAFVAGVRAALAERDPAAAARRRARGLARSYDDAARETLDAIAAIAEAGAARAKEQALRYFQHDRPEVRALIPAGAKRVLDVGCGAGALGLALKLERAERLEVVGIELDAAAARRAGEELDHVLQGDAVQRMGELPSGRFDAVVFADLLEHLAAPEAALAQARRLLAPGGVVVASLPNVRHWSVVRQLLEGDFRYEEAGILDRTHLRFFTKRSAERLLESAGFSVARASGVHWDDGAMPAELIEALRRGGLAVDDLAAEAREPQWLFVAQPVVRSVAPPEAPSVAAPAVAPAPRIAAAPPRRRALPSTSIVIPVCNAADYTAGCLAELESRGDDGALEVIVIDNGSRDHTADVLARHPRVQVIRNALNKGFAGAVNQGLAAARGDYVCVLNNDTVPLPGWLAPQVERLAADPSIGLIGPCTSYAKGRQQVDLGDGKPLASLDELRTRAARFCREQAGRLEDVAFLSGFCFTGRRADLTGDGGLADAYGRGTFEDDELCRQQRRRGQRLVIARDAYVHHYGNKTFKALAVDLAQQQQANWKLFAERHRDDPGLLARLCAEQGRWRDVLRLARAALAREPRDLDALFHAAQAAAGLARPTEAHRFLQRYLARCPHDVAAQELAARCEALSVAPRATRNGVPTAS
ncbi:MAG: glycosyltransferase [Planctomycetes bacterium]|nr:glycosyltransferase [Planctomycetota bacterium]